MLAKQLMHYIYINVSSKIGKNTIEWLVLREVFQLGNKSSSLLRAHRLLIE